MTLPRLFPVLVLLAWVGAMPARADGDDFFQGADTPLMSQIVFVGMVKDESGRHVGGALVTWRVMAHGTDQDAGQDQEEMSAGTYTDSIGRYRTIDLERIVHNHELELDPAAIELIVTKPGYTMIRRFRRTPAAQLMGLIEVDFTVGESPSRPH